MADKNDLLLLVGVAAAGYYLYTKSKGPQPATPGASGTGAPAPSPAATAPPAPTPMTSGLAPRTTAYGSSLKAKIVDAINASGVSTTYIYGQQASDTWNWYAMQALPGWTAPAPEQLFPGDPNAHKAVTFEDWFARVLPFLPGPSGVSGLGRHSPYFQKLYGGWMA